MTGESPSSMQSSSSQAEQGDPRVNAKVIAQMAHRASMDEFMLKLEEWIQTAYNWRKAAGGPVINVTLTEMQEAEIRTVIGTLEGVKKMYEEMMDGE